MASRCQVYLTPNPLSEFGEGEQRAQRAGGEVNSTLMQSPWTIWLVTAFPFPSACVGERAGLGGRRSSSPRQRCGLDVVSYNLEIVRENGVPIAWQTCSVCTSLLTNSRAKNWNNSTATFSSGGCQTFGLFQQKK